MSILEPETVDFVVIAKDHIALIQLDPLEWGGDVEDDEHSYYIQEAINSCLAYYESGQLAEDHPDKTHLPVKIIIVPAHSMNQSGLDLIEYGKPVVRDAGLELVVDADYGLDD